MATVADGQQDASGRITRDATRLSIIGLIPILFTLRAQRRRSHGHPPLERVPVERLRGAVPIARQLGVPVGPFGDFGDQLAVGLRQRPDLGDGGDKVLLSQFSGHSAVPDVRPFRSSRSRFGLGLVRFAASLYSTSGEAPDATFPFVASRYPTSGGTPDASTLAP